MTTNKTNKNNKHNGLGMQGLDAIDLEMIEQANAISSFRKMVGGIKGSRPIAGAGPRTLRVRRSHLRQCVASSSVHLLLLLPCSVIQGGRPDR